MWNGIGFYLQLKKGWQTKRLMTDYHNGLTSSSLSFRSFNSVYSYSALEISTSADDIFLSWRVLEICNYYVEKIYCTILCY